MITAAILPVVWVLLGAAGLCAGARLLRGPALVDSLLALDTLYILACTAIVLLQIQFATRVYFEAALLIALLGFIATAAFARFIEQEATPL